MVWAISFDLKVSHYNEYPNLAKCNQHILTKVKEKDLKEVFFFGGEKIGLDQIVSSPICVSYEYEINAFESL